jgi:hypothetical protein
LRRFRGLGKEQILLQEKKSTSLSKRIFLAEEKKASE